MSAEGDRKENRRSSEGHVDLVINHNDDKEDKTIQKENNINYS